MQGAMGRYHEAVSDFAGILESYANSKDAWKAGRPFARGQDVIDAADVLFDAAYDANLGVWPGDWETA